MHGDALRPARASQIPSDFEHLTYPKEMDKDDIREVQGFYVEAAKRAREAGFDIVYVYGSHSYLPQQFLTPYYNRRTDEYGGSFENRARFWRETIEQVREAVGDDCAIAVRMSTDMFMGEAGTQLERDCLPFVELVDEIVDVWDINVSGISEWGEDATPSRFYESGRLLPWQKARQGGREEAGARRRPLHEPRPDGRGDHVRLARHHRHLPPVDLRPVAPAQDRRGTPGRHPRVHRLQHLHLALGDRRPAAHLHAERDRGRGVPARLASREVRAGQERRQRRARRRRRPGRDGVRDGARQARHAPRAPRRGRRRHGRRMRWIPQLPGLGEWARVVNYRKIQIDKLKNVEFIPNTTLDAKGVEGVRRRRSSSSPPARYWATDGLNGCTHDTIPGADASLPWQLTPEQIMFEGKEVPGETRHHPRQRRLLHGRLPRREARAGRQEGHADDPPRPHRAVHALHARGAEPAPDPAQARRRDRHLPHADEARGGPRARRPRLRRGGTSTSSPPTRSCS